MAHTSRTYATYPTFENTVAVWKPTIRLFMNNGTSGESRLLLPKGYLWGDNLNATESEFLETLSIQKSRELSWPEPDHIHP